MRPHLPLATFALALLVVAATASADPAGPPGQWTRLPGTVINFAEPGLARTADGTLHVLYVRKNGAKSDLAHVAVNLAGKVGADAVALAGWSAMAHPDLLRMPNNTLRAFFGGIRSTAPGDDNDALNTATAPASGSPWTLQPGRAAQALYAYATSVTGAGLAKDGTPISTWSGSPGLGFHYGVSPSDPDGKIPQSGCCLYVPDVATDVSTGQSWVGFYSNENASPGVYANRISPAGPQGGRVLLPGSVTGKSSLAPGNRAAITGRLGAPGVYYVYGQGYPTFKTVALIRLGASKPHLVIAAVGMKHANIAAAPEGRLWLMWERSGTIYATRTNRAATRIGAATSIKPPGGGSVYRLNGEGSAGPLDLLANVQSGGQGFWHQQVLPRLELKATTKTTASGRTVVFRVTDAGDAVPGAKVKVSGKTLTTAANGTATLKQMGTARITATASKPGYAGATTKV
jgi:hypothetical protein